MSIIRYQVAVLKTRFVVHRNDTENFTVDFQNESDEFIMAIAPVKPDTIEGLTEIIMKILLPKQRPELRKKIAYLIGLQKKQQDVWTKYLADCEARTKNTNQWVTQNAR